MFFLKKGKERQTFVSRAVGVGNNFLRFTIEFTIMYHTPKKSISLEDLSKFSGFAELSMWFLPTTGWLGVDEKLKSIATSHPTT